MDAEFNIHGMWLRLDNRRDDELRSNAEGAGLLSEVRILQPRAMLRTLMALEFDKAMYHERALAPATQQP